MLTFIYGFSHEKQPGTLKAHIHLYGNLMPQPNVAEKKVQQQDNLPTDKILWMHHDPLNLPPSLRLKNTN